jgi:DNA polymerase I-like protein with 3'-5' exonuclease and polymerase domains
MKDLVKREMESAVEFIVPIEVEMEVADNWLDAH